MKAKLIRDTIVVQNIDAVYLYAQSTQQVARVPKLTTIIKNDLVNKGFFNIIPRSMRYRPPIRWKSLMLLLTKDCPLKCRYCYAHGGSDNAMMSPEVADRAITAYLATNPKNPRVILFGGGEPAMNIPTIKHVVSKYGARIKWHMTTSGVMSQSFLRWLIEHKVGMTISIDGPPDIQNDLRPLRGNGESAAIVEQTIRTLATDPGRRISMRTTITRDTLHEINRILNYFNDLGAKSVHIERVYSLGRALEDNSDDLQSLSLSETVEMTVLGLNWAKETGKRLKIGSLAYLLNPRISHYCGAMSGQSMVVNHLGQLTTCSEVIDDQTEEWPLFHLGHIDKHNQLHLDEKKLSHFQHRIVSNMEACKSCFARYICRGGCTHKAWAITGDIFSPDPQHCQFMRTIIPIMIKRMVDQRL